MDFGAILIMLANMNPIAKLVFTVLGILVVAAQAVVLLTPTPVDDNWMAKIEAIPVVGSVIRALKSFAPFQKK